MKKDFLVKIEASVRARVNRDRLTEGVAVLQEKASHRSPTIDLAQRILQGKGTRLIAEIKRKNPSLGMLYPDLDPIQQATDYLKFGAVAISVLTEPEYFAGSLRDLELVKSAVPDLPVLMKDFVMDTYQILQGRAYGADAVLLISSFLGQERLQELYHDALSAKLTPFVEVHTESEFEAAMAMGAKFIGVNNRNLQTLEINLDVSRRLVRFRKGGFVLVSESGIKSRSEIKELEALGYEAFLVGTSIVREPRFIEQLRQDREFHEIQS